MENQSQPRGPSRKATGIQQVKTSTVHYVLFRNGKSVHNIEIRLITKLVGITLTIHC